MERRVFFKILSATSAAVATSSCGSKSPLMPLLVPETQIAPGEEQWHTAVCTACDAGCGTIVRVMQSVRVIEQNGEKVGQPIAAIKKIEGNPLDPISGGRLCARGQAEVQSLYHPDRLQGPKKRSGDRGSGKFDNVTWEAAIASAAEIIARVAKEDASKIAILTGPGVGTRSLALERFAKALKAPAPIVCSIADHALERKAAELVFGWKGLPVYDLANARYILGVGADFLGAGPSSVYYARQYGNFRRGRTDIRGYFVHAESRLSLTASSADRWLPVRPGTEPQFLAAVGKILIDGKLGRNASALPKRVADVFAGVDLKATLSACGIEERRLRDVVQELAASEAPLIVAGSSLAQSNSLEALIAGHYLNLMLGSVGKPGGVLPPAKEVLPIAESRRTMDALANAKVVLIAGANPAYILPKSSGLQDALKKAESVISFAPFVDDSAAWSDLILPDHHALESEVAMVASVSTEPAVAVAVPFVTPLYDTRSVEKTLADIAEKAGAAYEAVSAQNVYQSLLSDDITPEDVARQGGIWASPNSSNSTPKAADRAPEFAAAVFDGDVAQYPFHFQPYLSVQFHDGSGAHLPWMQELPDPASSSIWGLPVEIDPKTAEDLKVANGDVVRIESRNGSIEAPAYVHPGAIPGVVSMAIGDGHTSYSRYASGRGGNPLSILAAVWEKNTGALVTGGTRVRLSRVSDRKGWIQFTAPDREERDTHR